MSLSFSIIATVIALAIAIAILGLAIAPLWPSIGGLPGLAAFWLVSVLLGSWHQVRMPGGTLVDVGITSSGMRHVLGARPPPS